jgi:hypothetical protein
MKKLLLFFLVLCLLYVGCAANFGYQYTHVPQQSQVVYRHIPVYVDVQFGEADRLGIENALNSWNYVLNGYIKFEAVSYSFDMEPAIIQRAINQRGLLILKINSTSSFIPPVSNGRVRAFCNDDKTIMYVVRDNIPTEEVEFTTLHELGHVLGAPDVDGEPILMNRAYSPRYSKCVDKRSMEYVAEAQRLDPNKLNYCEYVN